MPPFRLDLTVDALRRLAANVVDVVAPDGTYYRALSDAEGVAAIAVSDGGDGASIEVRVAGPNGARWFPVVERMLGTQRDLREWRKRAKTVPWLAPLAKDFDGVKPPRYATVWEACAHAIVFAQISIHAAAAIMRRAVEALGEEIVAGGVRCVAFPPPQRWIDASDETLRAAGLSRNKVAHLRSVATAFQQGVLADAQLEELPTAQLAERLVAVRGLGPWSASVVMLRGLGRLDTFPMRDSGVARTVTMLGGGGAADLDVTLERLGPVKGMLYYHLLLGRLRNRSEGPGGS